MKDSLRIRLHVHEHMLRIKLVAICWTCSERVRKLWWVRFVGTLLPLASHATRLCWSLAANISSISHQYLCGFITSNGSFLRQQWGCQGLCDRCLVCGCCWLNLNRERHRSRFRQASLSSFHSIPPHRLATRRVLVGSTRTHTPVAILKLLMDEEFVKEC